MNVVVVVPWRAGQLPREVAWEWCRSWWEQFDWPIFEVEHPPPAPFNRSWTINEGARRAWPWDVLVIADADVFEEDPQQVRDGVERCLETGKLTIPHTGGTDLNQRGTQALLQGQAGWRRQVAKQRPVCTSRVTIARADLFEEVGGFDTRFRGWGWEDVAFFRSARSIRGCDQLPGTAFHLWHPPSVHIARRTREYIAGRELCNRYIAADGNGWLQLAPILAERKPEERWDRPNGSIQLTEAPSSDRGVDVIVLTAGRREYLERTLKSFEERVHGDIRNRTIQDDSGDSRFGAWLKETYPEWEILRTRGRLGYTQAIRSAWMHEARRNGSGAPYIFHLEEDFTFDRDVDVNDLVRILEEDPKIAQAALLRGAFFPPEIEAGGIVEQDPDAYEARHGARPYLVHRKYFTTNPCIYRRSLIRTGWPNAKSSETVFTRQLVRRGFSFALLGDGTPWVSHIGEVRTGLGY